MSNLLKKQLLAHGLAILFAMLAAIGALWPRWAWASGCGYTDPGACMDLALYNFWQTLTALEWSIVRALLYLAYVIQGLHWWLVETVFTDSYAVLTSTLGPLFPPMAILALTVGALAFLVMPLWGSARLINIRQALVLTLLGPLVLGMSASWLVQLEQLRSDLNVSLFNSLSTKGGAEIQQLVDSATPTRRQVGPVVPLYPANPPVQCGTKPPITRPGSSQAVTTTQGFYMDDLAAAMVWADGIDIHCPDQRNRAADGMTLPLPAKYYVASPNGAQFAYSGSIDTLSASQRATRIADMQLGMIQTAMALLPTALAVMDAVVELLFAGALILLWVSIPFAMLWSYFEQSLSSVAQLLRKVFEIVKASVMGTFFLALIFAGLQVAAMSQSASAFTGFSLGAIIVTGALVAMALAAFKDGIAGFANTVGGSAALKGAGDALSLTAKAGTAVASGGASAIKDLGATALTGAMAYQQTGSGRYAVAAMAGRIRPVARLGEVAAHMGLIAPEKEAASGLYAGQRSTEGLRVFSAAMSADRQRSITEQDSASGQEISQTFRQRAQRRRLARQQQRIERAGLRGETNRMVGETAVATVRGVHAFGKDLVDRDVLGGVAERVGHGTGVLKDGLIQLPGGVSRGFQHGVGAIGSGSRAAYQFVREGGVGDAVVAGSKGLVKMTTGGAVALAQGVVKGTTGGIALVGRGGVAAGKGLWHLATNDRRNEATRMFYGNMQLLGHITPPEDAFYATREQINAPLLWQQGYIVQDELDDAGQATGKVRYWLDPEGPLSFDTGRAPAGAPQRQIHGFGGHLYTGFEYELFGQGVEEGLSRSDAIQQWRMSDQGEAVDGMVLRPSGLLVPRSLPRAQPAPLVPPVPQTPVGKPGTPAPSDQAARKHGKA